MDARTIQMNNEALRIGSDCLLTQLRCEGLRYRMWVTGADRGSAVHIRIAGLTAEKKGRVCNVLKGRGTSLDIDDMQSA